MVELWPVVLAGGSGTRLWPLSRMEYPKQLLRLQSSSSLLQETILRLSGLDDDRLRIGEMLFVCNHEHRYFVAQQLDAIEGGLGRAAHILLEPAGRNTAPALTAASLVAARSGSDPVLLVLAADHFIGDVAAFHAAVRLGVQLAVEGGLGTFGIVPTRAETGYGYIRCGAATVEGARAIEAFVEKPDEPTAQSYVDGGDYLWNSGMFVMRASTWLRAIERFRPEISRACSRSIERGKRNGREIVLDPEAFSSCPSDSIDYAVMEPLAAEVGAADSPAASTFVVPLDAGWSDVGTWNSLLEVGEHDEDGNVIAGDVFHHDTRDTLVLSHHRFVATLGLDAMVVVETPDAVLVADKAHAQDVRHVVAWLNERNRSEAKVHRRVYFPWGSAESLRLDLDSHVLRMVVKPGVVLEPRSGLRHREQWLIVRGQARAEVDGETRLLRPGDSVSVAESVSHGLENSGDSELELLVVRLGEHIQGDVAWLVEER